MSRFADFAAIDRPGVHIIVNPGGTNEQFVRSHIKHAAIVLHPDNTTIFAALADGAADAMITDLVEARFQAAHNPLLCVALHGARLSVTDKAVLMPRDAALAGYVNLWLRQIRADGHLDAVVSRYLPKTHRHLQHEVLTAH